MPPIDHTAISLSDGSLFDPDHLDGDVAAGRSVELYLLDQRRYEVGEVVTEPEVSRRLRCVDLGSDGVFETVTRFQGGDRDMEKMEVRVEWKLGGDRSGQVLYRPCAFGAGAVGVDDP